MKPSIKVGLVAAGYILALLIAQAAVAIHEASTRADSRGSDGMYAFGDSLLFLAVFGVAAVPATGAALYFLKSYSGFWRVLSVLALVVAGTGLAAGVLYLVGRGASTSPTLQLWSAFAVLRILGAPLMALIFLLAGLFAPDRPDRGRLLIATASEAAVFGCIGFIWLLSFHAR